MTLGGGSDRSAPIGAELKREEGSRAPRGVVRLAPSADAATAEDASAAALLGRLPVDLDVDAHSSYVRGATILVTGAGGSIGRELCARLVGLRARRLILVDQAEAPLLELAAALRQEHGVVDVVAVLADVRSEARAAAVFEEHTPDVVFHAAAYKQVPLLEAHPLEGVATNVLGTKSVVDAAVRVGAARFVLFSSDKAVRPSNVLGRTKALAECVVAAGGRQACQGGYVAVRLGNVVDSSGSILPLFRRQVERGGPITVTHPQMTRYFITVREAAALAIVAGGIGEANEAFCLDAGPPVRIVDIAQRFADAAAVDVSIDFVGVRAGERMHESLFWSDDDVFETRCRRVLGSPLPAVDPAAVAWWLAELARHVQTASTADVLGVLAEATAEPRASDALPDAVALQ